LGIYYKCTLSAITEIKCFQTHVDMDDFLFGMWDSCPQFVHTFSYVLDICTYYKYQNSNVLLPVSCHRPNNVHPKTLNLLPVLASMYPWLLKQCASIVVDFLDVI
jgi:hypothetical protein